VIADRSLLHKRRVAQGIDDPSPHRRRRRVVQGIDDPLHRRLVVQGIGESFRLRKHLGAQVIASLRTQDAMRFEVRGS
jgi:hypothetical protein